MQSTYVHTHTHAMRDRQTCASSCERNLENVFKFYAPCWRGTFDVVYIYLPRVRLSVGKLHIRIYMWRRAAAHICPPVCIALSQFRVMKLTWSVRYHIVRDATNSLYHSRYSPLYRFIPIISPEPTFVVSCPTSSLRFWHTSTRRIHLKKCAGGRPSACSHSTSVGRRLPESKELMPIRER